MQVITSRPSRLSGLRLGRVGLLGVGLAVMLSLVSLVTLSCPAHAATTYPPTPPAGHKGPWVYGPKACEIDFYDPAYPKNNGRYAGLGGGTSVRLGGNRAGLAMLVKAGFGHDDPTLSEAEELSLVANTIKWESRWCPQSFNRNDFGLAQINKAYHPDLYRRYNLADPQQSISAMRELFLPSARTTNSRGPVVLDVERGLRPWLAHGKPGEVNSRPKMLALVKQWLVTQGRG